MKHTIIKYFFVFLSLFICYSCSTPLPEIKKVNPEEKRSSIYENELRINTKQIYCWVNKMPGDKARFNLSGELELFDDSDYDIKNITIKKIYISQNNVAIYQFTPKLESKLANNSKSILFSTVKGLLLSIQLDVQKNIEVKLLLSDSNKDIEYYINKVKVEEVY